MRTHIPVGVSIPKDMHDLITIDAEDLGMKRSAWFQQLAIERLKVRFPHLSTADIMGTPMRDYAQKQTPAQRVALAKLEIAKEAKRSKKAK